EVLTQAGLSDLPHSKQQVLVRDVINPQNGHILCEWTSSARGLIIARSFPNQSIRKAIRLRRRLRNGPVEYFMMCFRSFPPEARSRLKMQVLMDFLIRRPCKLNDGRPKTANAVQDCSHSSKAFCLEERK